jgi:hypothetical protein
MGRAWPLSLLLSVCERVCERVCVLFNASWFGRVVQDVFYGVPFAAPPLGNLRWKTPQQVFSPSLALLFPPHAPPPHSQRNLDSVWPEGLLWQVVPWSGIRDATRFGPNCMSTKGDYVHG